MLGESEDETDKPITHVEGVGLARRRNSSSASPTAAALYSWKEVRRSVSARLRLNK